VAVFWLVLFAAGMWGMRKRKDLCWTLLTVFFLSAIQPIFVSQTRSVWNPSFLPPLLTISFLSFFLLEVKYTRLRLWVWALSTSLAISLHFPIGALALAQLMYGIVFFRKNLFGMVVSLASALVFFNLPTLVFEMRHGFLITRNVLGGDWLGLSQFSRGENLWRLIDFSGGQNVWWANVGLFLILGITAWRKLRKEKDLLLKQTAFVFVVSAILTVVSGLAFHSHYAFGFATAWFFVLSRLPWKISASLLLGLAIIWLNPTQVAKYFAPARRSLEEINICLRQVCVSEKEPVFVSVQSGVSPFHVGYEYRYLMKKNGCEVRYIETDPESATKMAVVLDGSSYEHGKTTYNELTLFGDSKMVKTYDCGKGFGVVILSRP
jgi:hypothetical protein